MKRFYLLLICLVMAATSNGQNHSWKALSGTGEAQARHENALVAAGNKIILIGGRGNKPVDLYDISTQTWSKGAQPPYEIHHLQAVELDGLVYALGGFTGSWPYETPQTHVLIYDPIEDLWIIGPEIPAHRRRGAAGVVTHNSKIYLINGIINGHTSGWVNWLDEFDPYANEWKELPNAPQARDHFQAAVINNNIYVAGGRRSGSGDNGFAGTIEEAYVFDLNTNSWKMIPPIPTERAGTGAVNYNQMYVVIGGESENQEAAHNEVEAFDPQTKTWKTLPALSNGRHGTQVVTIKNTLIIGAGSANRGGGPELNTFEIFSSEEEEKSLLTPQINFPSEELRASTTTLKLNGKERADFTIKNPSANKAVIISYLLLDNTEDFKVELLQKNARPLVLAPGAEKTISVKSTGALPEDPSAVMFIKTLGNSEPLQVKISN